MPETISSALESLTEGALLYLGDVCAAVAIFILGFLGAKLVKGILRRMMTSRGVDPAIVVFMSNIAYYVLLVMVLIATISKLGIQTTSFVAIIGAAGLAVGLALQGSLSNFAAGFLIIIFRPFKTGDYVNAGGAEGFITAIDIFYTVLKTVDNKVVIIPNSKITSDNIVNFSKQETRRVDHVVGVSYGDDIEKVRSILKRIADEDPRILKDPPVDIFVREFADSSVNFTFRGWVKTADYWDVFFNNNEKIKKYFDAEGVSIPFPQRDVHLYEHKS